MTASQRRKGADSERALVRWFTDHGYPARRSFSGDGKQAGDIDGMGCVIEVKAHARPRIDGWLRILEKVRGDSAGFLVWHEPGKGDPGAWPVFWINGLGITQVATVAEVWEEGSADDFT